MGRILFTSIVSLLLIFNLSLINAHFVCGFVDNSEEYSSSWIDVIVFSEKNVSKFITCKINPENKFCCDLEELDLLKIDVGEKISAEIFEEESGLVAGPVELVVTEEGYDLFPEMVLEKAIIFNSPEENIFINQSLIQINISLAENYNNLRYSLNSSERYLEEDICEDCNNIYFEIPLDKGKNEVIFTAYNKREISEKIIFYNLDYLNFNLDVICSKCKIIRNNVFVPSDKEINFLNSFNASHNISGEFLFYFPSDWQYFDSLNTQDLSTTHSIIGENVLNKKEFTFSYIIKSPKTFFKKRYDFYQKIENKESLTEVYVSKLWFLPFPKQMPFEYGYQNSPFFQKISPDEPFVIYPKEESLNIIAIFPDKPLPKSLSNIKIAGYKNKKIKKYSFVVITNIPRKNIEKIFLLFSVKKDKSIEVYTNNKEDKLNLEFYEEDSDYIYYSTFVNQKGPFYVEIS